MPGTLSHSPAEVIQRALVELGHGVLAGQAGNWPIGAYNEGNVDNTITVYDVAGFMEGRRMTDGLMIDRPGIQVRVRSYSENLGYAKARQIATALDQILRMELAFSGSTYFIQSVTRTTDVINIGKQEETNLQLFTINATVSLRQL